MRKSSTISPAYCLGIIVSFTCATSLYFVLFLIAVSTHSTQVQALEKGVPAQKLAKN